MLVHLSIRDIVLIDQLDIDFKNGLSVLTGETGAGKSILLDSLALALGGRGDASLVRSGEAKGQITAVFDVPSDHAARRILDANDIDHDGDLILRRVQNADGRTRVYINDQTTSVAMMASLGHALVEIHGQHDDRALVDPVEHRRILDVFGGFTGDVTDLGTRFQAWRKAETALARHRAKVEAAAKEADYLRASADELGNLSPQLGEEEELAGQRSEMMKSEKIAKDLIDAEETVSGQQSAVPDLSALARQLDRKKDDLPGILEPIIEAIDAALVALDTASDSIRVAIEQTAFRPEDLEDTEERLFALRAASRKYGVPVESLAKLRQELEDKLQALDAGESALAGLEADVTHFKAEYDGLAKQVSEARKQIATQLVAKVHEELPDLKLERAEFIIQHEADAENRTAEGIDQIEFWVRTNPGTRAGPMMKVASGGELSRFLLALKVALADKGSAPTLVFDEIDTGVGGAVADAIGRRLARLSSSVQVLSVTHAPQVAARAYTHFLIAKDGLDDGRVATRITPLADADRQEEIARMLAGATITDEARQAASSLLSASGGQG